MPALCRFLLTKCVHYLSIYDRSIGNIIPFITKKSVSYKQKEGVTERERERGREREKERERARESESKRESE